MITQQSRRRISFALILALTSIAIAPVPARAASVSSWLKKLVKKFMMAIVREYAGKWMSDIEDYMRQYTKDYTKNDAKIAVKVMEAFGVNADSINEVAKTISDAELQQEVAPAPGAHPELGKAASSIVFASQASGKAVADVANKRAQILAGQRTENQQQERRALMAHLLSATKDQRIAWSDPELLVQQSGYSPAEVDDAKQLITIMLSPLMLGSAHRIIRDDEDAYSKQDPNHLTWVSRYNLIQAGLDSLYTTRLRNEALFQDCKSSEQKSGTDSVIADIVDGDSAASEIDMLNWLVGKRWNNTNWHTRLNALPSLTAAIEELNDVQAEKSMLRLRIVKLEEQIGLVQSVLSALTVEQSRRG